jgi:hypothetical protein
MSTATAIHADSVPGKANGAEIGLNDKSSMIEQLIIAGWTGRNQAAVEAHIEELEKLGVSRPKSTPIFYRVAASLLTQSTSIQVIGTDSSGEAEPVLINVDDKLWVGVGSDHTDRKVEAYNVTVSKQICAKPVSKQYWAFNEVVDHWDDIILRSFAHTGNSKVLYQEGKFSAIRPPNDLLSLHEAEAGGLSDRSAMYCGTVAVIGDVRSAEAYTIEIEDPVLGRSISHSYAVETLPIQ